MINYYYQYLVCNIFFIFSREMSPYWLSDHHSIECDWSINPGKGQSRPIIAGTSTSLPGVNTLSDDRNLLKNSIIFYSLFFQGDMHLHSAIRVVPTKMMVLMTMMTVMMVAMITMVMMIMMRIAILMVSSRLRSSFGFIFKNKWSHHA